MDGSKGKNVLSIDIGGSKMLAGIVNSDGRVLHKRKLALSPVIDGEALIQHVITLVNELEGDYPQDFFDCAGVTIPGLADPENGMWIYACFSGIRDFPIVEVLSKQLGVPVFIDNDVNACAYGEKIYGKGKSIDDFLWITVSNGVGGALVLNGELYRGFGLSAGEIGHFNVQEGGYPCGCGNKGCLEASAAGPAIVRRYLERKKQHDTGITAEQIAQAAKQGEAEAIEVFNETGYFLGKAISYAVNLINPQKVILGGGVSMSSELFIRMLKDTLDSMMFREANKELEIEQTALGYDAALVGAAALAQKGMGRI